MKLRLDNCKVRTHCAICGKKLDKSLINLLNYPLTETYLESYEPIEDWSLDQEFYFCKHCGHGQLGNVIPREILYGNIYKFKTSESGSTSSNNFLLKFINGVTKNKRFKKVVDIGCNDGYLLRKLKGKSDEFIGIDPTIKSREEDGIKFIGEFVEDLDIDFKDSLVITNQVLEHIEEPKEFLKGLVERSNDNTIFVFSYPSFNYLMADCRFDQIYHHHLHYFSLTSTIELFNQVGCVMDNYIMNPHYWGSLLVTFKKSKVQSKYNNTIERGMILAQYELFRMTMKIIDKYLEVHRNHIIFGYGAGFQLPVLNYYIPNIKRYMNLILDDNANKENLLYPGLRQEIIKPYEGLDLTEKIVLITAPSYSREIINRLYKLNPKRILIPVGVI